MVISEKLGTGMGLVPATLQALLLGEKEGAYSHHGLTPN